MTWKVSLPKNHQPLLSENFLSLWHRYPISLDQEVFHMSENLGCLRSWRYSISCPVSLSRTGMEHLLMMSMGDFCQAELVGAIRLASGCREWVMGNRLMLHMHCCWRGLCWRHPWRWHIWDRGHPWRWGGAQHSYLCHWCCTGFA